MNVMDFLYQYFKKRGKMYNLLDYTIDEFNNLELFKSEKSFRKKQVFNWLHNKLVSDFRDMTNIPNKLIEVMEKEYYIGGLELDLHLKSKIDNTEKFLFTLKDNNQIESVLMRYKHGNTACISTKVGCRMGCKFCASTIDGLVRNLSSGEMLAQIYNISRITKQKISNIVLMGQGEPLDNYDNLLKFLYLINDENGLNISRRNITISTCGIVPKIIQLADDGITSNLAISLHSPFDELRRQILPIAYKYSIKEIIEAVDYYIKKTSRRVSFEYALIKGINDTQKCADEIINLMKNKLYHLNIIPVNNVEEREFTKPDKKNISKFFKYIENNNINVTIRKEMGSDISGACGQLRRRVKEYKCR